MAKVADASNDPAWRNMKSWFANLKLSAKLSLGFGITSFLTLAVTILAVGGIGSLHGDIRSVGDKALSGEVSLAQFGLASTQFRVLQYRTAGITGTKAEEMANLADNTGTKADQALTEFSSKVTDPEERKLTEDVIDGWRKYEEVWKEIRPKILVVSAADGYNLMESRTDSFNSEFMPALNKLSEWNLKFGAKTSKQADSDAGSLTSSVTTMGLAAVGLSIFLAIGLVRKIVAPISAVSAGLKSIREHCLRDLTNGLNSLRAGDLTQEVVAVTKPIENNSHDEIGLMTSTYNDLVLLSQESIESYNQARTSWVGIVNNLGTSAVAVADTSRMLEDAFEQSRAASVEIATGSEQLARGATQAASVMDELLIRVATVKSSSQNQEFEVSGAVGELQEAEEGINGVAGAAQEMTAAAQEGNLAVSQTIASMDRVRDRVGVSALKVKELDEKGKQIGHIVQSIESIAGQTNLLALNAAIEAARAGEHGRGFAVVADEVRKLAEQASNATQEISTLISGVTATVSQTVEAIESASAEVIEGAARSEVAGRSLNHILKAAEQVATQAEQVAAKTQQATGRITNISLAARSNSESTEEIAEGSNTVANAISNVAAVSQESAAGAQELSATIHQIGEAARELTTMSKDLHGVIAKFNTGQVKAKTKALRIAA